MNVNNSFYFIERVKDWKITKKRVKRRNLVGATHFQGQVNGTLVSMPDVFSLPGTCFTEMILCCTASRTVNNK